MLSLQQLARGQHAALGKFAKQISAYKRQSVPIFRYSRACGGSNGGWQDRKITLIRYTGGGSREFCRTFVSQPTFSITVADTRMNHENAILKVSWNDGNDDVFPYIWLRDNCQCSSCFHPSSKSRIHLIQDLDLNTRPFDVKVVDGGKGVDITWTDGHSSTYLSEWLHPRAFNTSRWSERAPTYKLKRSYWGTNIMKNLPQASFHELLQEDAAVLSWLQQLEVYGFALISGAPTKTGQVRALAKRVAFIKTTHYGEDFSVIAKNDPSNVAYSSGPLQLHADLPYYEYKPGVQFIHCIVQYAGEGGDSRVADAVHVARELKRLHPDHYEILTTTMVDWYDEGTDEMGEFNKVLRLPMICTDEQGEIWRINFSQPQRDSFFPTPAEKVAGWYEAMTNFHMLLCDPQYCFQFKMVPGTILTFDNLRIVHGRSGYKTGFGERHIEGCYLDWDEVRSRRRVLEKKLGITPRQWVTGTEEVE